MKLVNLLPQQYQKRYRVYLIGLYVRRFLALQIIIAVVVGAILAGLYIYYDSNVQRARTQTANLQKAQEQFAVEEIRTMANAQNDTLKVSAQIISLRPQFSLVLDELASLVPVGITLDTVSVGAFPSTIVINGRAQSRDKVVLLQNRLEGSELLKLTFAPLSNLTQANNTPFEFTLNFDVKKVVLPQ